MEISNSFISNGKSMTSSQFIKPLSSDMPSAEDLELDTELQQHLRSCGIFETSDGQHRRESVIMKLECLVNNWALDLAEKKNKSLTQPFPSYRNPFARLVVFGSQRLSVHSVESDVDVLCLCPNFVTRGDFFTSFIECIAADSNASMVISVPEAFTPVVKFNFCGQAIDMIFATWPSDTVPLEPDLLDDQCLRFQDEKGVRSLNGARVAEMILNLVPDQATYTTSLRAIKLWARRRGVYSNVLGFLGGINFAIMVAFICQLFPNACAASIIQSFFKVYAHWVWPNPIMIAAPVDYSSSEFSGLTSWNYVKNAKDRMDIMPIITPAFPQMNSAYNVGMAQFRSIQEEIVRGYRLFDRYRPDREGINHKRNAEMTDTMNKESNNLAHASNGPEAVPVPLPTEPLWEELFTSAMPSFLDKFPRYVQVDIATKADETTHRKWFSWCESRMRNLFRGLESPPYVFCHPITNCYHRKHVEMLQTSESLITKDKSPNLPVSKSDGAPRSSLISSTPAPRVPPPAAITPLMDQISVGLLLATPAPRGAVATQDTQTKAYTSAEMALRDLRSHQTPVGTRSGARGGSLVESFESSYFIGLTFCNGLRSVDLTTAIQDFIFIVNVWERKTSDMTISIKFCRPSDIPSFALELLAGSMEPVVSPANTPIRAISSMLSNTPGSASSQTHSGTGSNVSAPTCNEPSSLFVDELEEQESALDTVESTSQASSQSDGEVGNTRSFKSGNSDAHLASGMPPTLTAVCGNDRKRRVKSYEAKSETMTGASVSPSHVSPDPALPIKGCNVRETLALQSDSSPMKRSRNVSRRSQK